MAVPIILAVALGSAIGAVARFSLSLLAFDMAATGLPWPTLVANIVGSFLIGWVAAACGPQGRFKLSAPAYQFLVTGFCGGFTTFSLFSLELYILLEQGALTMAVVYGLVSIVTWLLAVAVGYRLGARRTPRAD